MAHRNFYDVWRNEWPSASWAQTHGYSQNYCHPALSSTQSGTSGGLNPSRLYEPAQSGQEPDVQLEMDDQTEEQDYGNGVSHRSRSTTPTERNQCDLEMEYSYRVKIINKSKKSDFITRDLRSFSGKFESIRSVKLKLMEEFDTLVPSSTDFNVGYFSGKQNKKQWLMDAGDLTEMYDGIKKSGSVLLWCDSRLTGGSSNQNRKRPSTQSAPKSKRLEIEDDVDELVRQLQENHEDKYSIPQLRLWARYVQAGHYKDLVKPPPLPALTGTLPKRERKESLSDAIAGAAITFVNAMRSPDLSTSSNVKAQNSVVINAQTPPKSGTTIIGISPGRATDLRMRKLKELRELQTLLEQNILNEDEFAEQKAIVLESLRKLNQ